jgi:hypothetical protein
MSYGLLTEATVALHFAFIVFVVLGGLLVLRRPVVAWLHVPAVAWVVWLPLTGASCPLTLLEKYFRTCAGDAGYAGGFIEHYLTPMVHPAWLTPRIQLTLGIVVLALNVAVYAALWRRSAR